MNTGAIVVLGVCLQLYALWLGVLAVADQYGGLFAPYDADNDS